MEIRLNQLAFGTNWPKSGFVVSDGTAERAEIIAPDRGSVVLSVPVRPTAHNGLFSFDFSNVVQAGRYTIRIGSVYSSPFLVAQAPNQELERLLLDALELQRCGVEVKDGQGRVLHRPCHLEDGIFNGREQLERMHAAGGWHDAGDYGKYVATTAPTIVRLLDIVEWQEKVSEDSRRASAIPRDGVFGVAKVGLDWLLRMQRADGAVYRKLSGKTWPGEILPEADAQPRYIFGISTEETGKFAGTMAVAARLFRKIDRAYAERCLQAAERAWRYLERHEYLVEKGADDDSGSGAYPSRVYDDEWTCYTDADDRLWAAIELYLTSNKSSYKEYFLSKLQDKQMTPFEWKDMSTQGLLDYYFLAPGLSGSDRSMIREKVAKKAEQLVLRSDTNEYGVGLNRFKWGSNKYVAEDGITLLWAFRMTGEKSFLRAAVSQLNYLFGQNALGKCFVTGVGVNPVRHPHHRLMRALGRSLPGFLVGGPTDVAASGVLRAGLGPRGYADNERAYESNEPAIDYNASLLFFLALLDDLGR